MCYAVVNVLQTSTYRIIMNLIAYPAVRHLEFLACSNLFARMAILFVVLVFFSFAMTQQSVAGGTNVVVTGTEVVPADVLLAIRQLDQEVEFLRQYMGVPKVNVLGLRVSNSAPHEVYFQALTLFQKVNRLSFEITRERRKPPETPVRIHKPADVLVLVEASHQLLDLVMSEFGVVLEHIPVERTVTTQPAEVFLAILATNRQLNRLLRQHFESSDVYMQVTQAIGYGTRLLTPYLDATPIPDPPAFVPNKTPGDVYLRLLDCLVEVQKIYAIVTLPLLDIDATQIEIANITPSDVFDLSALLVARLDYLYQQLGQQLGLEKPPQKAFYPGRKYPSDVYRRAGILLNQLQQLAKLAASHGLSGLRHGVGR